MSKTILEIIMISNSYFVLPWILLITICVTMDIVGC